MSFLGFPLKNQVLCLLHIPFLFELLKELVCQSIRLLSLESVFPLKKQDLCGPCDLEE
jgi:hypothetical protein